MAVISKGIVAFKNKWEKFLSSDTFLKLLETYIVEEGILKQISIGQSPIKTYGRFDGYAVERVKGKPKNQLYPNSVKSKYPGKLRRPVNLKLSGEYLKKIGIKKLKDGSFSIGLINPTNKQKKMYETHNLGKHPHVPMRKHLPSEIGDEFKDVIMQEFRKGLIKAFKQQKLIK